MNRSVFVRSSVVLALAGAMLAGCGAMRPSQSTEIFEATLSGGEEVPAKTTGGSGTAEVHYNRNTSMLRYKVSYSGMTGPVTAAHIHGPAAPGANAGVLVPFTGALNVSPFEGEVHVTPEQAAQIASGQTYVNLHTAQNPGGEVRGQLRARRG
jgi:hypothetical protein